jgi:hypothetical protein
MAGGRKTAIIEKTEAGGHLASLMPRVGSSIKINPSQFFGTPEIAPLAFLAVEGRRLFSLSRRVWECASGEGHFSRVLAAHGFSVVSTDIRSGPRIHGTGGVDFLTTRKARAPVIITNPPYGPEAAAFVRHARALGVVYIALLLPSTFFQMSAANAQLFLDLPPTRIWPFAFRLDFTRQGKTPPVFHAMFVWDWSPRPREPRREFRNNGALLMPPLQRPEGMSA